MDVIKAPTSRRRRRVLGGLAAAAVIVGITVGVAGIRRGVPVVSRSTVVIGTVRRGEMVREVRGAGALVPKTTRLITADTQARVERIRVAPGDRVEVGTVIVELANPDLELRALEVAREVATARTNLAALEATLESQRLALEAEIAGAAGELSDARRRGTMMIKMQERGLVAAIEKDDAISHSDTLAARLAFTRRRLSATTRSMRLQIEAQKGEIARRQSLVTFTERQVSNLSVTASGTGVVQEVPLLIGQTIVVGQLLAKVVDPTQLKAELRIPETQIKDVVLGLRAVIDTRSGRIAGRVVRIDPAAVAGTIKIDIDLEGILPPGARPDLTVDGVVEIERLEDVLLVGRPTFAEAASRMTLFVLRGGDEAVRVAVELGKVSVHDVEIRSGLSAGDAVILSDLPRLGAVDRIRLQ